ncbi:hypothetical protein PVAND_004418 [Polypedilum vanderplanki]|uniref:TLC domain-containing protein n=1 Tax=Polypedilum vanderplanki TaxID=319348 RepID=A0A9J6BXN3_POLVA|nr:hypothetical protein PVAND_004418 [Polypedilum vanderplanki]
MTKIFQMDLSNPQHVRTTIISMIASFLLYFIIYKILRRKVNVSPEYEIRLLTFFHGVFSSTCALHYVVLPALGYYEVSSIPFKLILSHSMGYFTFDLLWCFWYGESGVMKFHHIVTVTGLMYYSFKFSQQYVILYSLGLTEFTNPLLQIRWYLKHHGLRDTLLFKIVEALFILAFFSIRVFVFSYYAYIGWTDPKYGFTGDDLFFITLGLIVGYSLSYQMFGYIMHQLRKSKSKKNDKKE